MSALGRGLLGMAVVILAGGAVMHARAFPKTVTAVAASNLPAFYANSLKALWLIDSATLLTLAVLYALAAARPASVSRATLALTALIPASTAIFLYVFLGGFLPAHGLLAAAVLVWVAAIVAS
ncbi:MAG TPA: hypothetical protein VLA96_01880 [Terriglobales bacterium]|nr:hypothetical protein [Terriglobales bacterium]